MGVLHRLSSIFRRQRPEPTAPAPEPPRTFYRFMEMEPLLQPGQGPLHAAIVMGAFCDVMLRIVARHGEAETTVEVDGLDVTTRPLEPRENDAEYLGRLARQARLVHERAVVSPEALARFRSELGPGGGFELTDASATGFDGYTLRAAVTDGMGRTQRFSAWSPQEETPHFRFLQALHGLASESVRGWRAQSALDSLHSYTGLGERFRDFGGTPRLVRLWGRMDSEDAGLALVEQLKKLPGTGPIVLDLRWFHWPPATLAAALRWAAEHPGVRVVMPQYRRRFGDAVQDAGRTFRVLAEALGEDR